MHTHHTNTTPQGIPRNKIVSAVEAVRLIHDGDTVATGGLEGVASVAAEERIIDLITLTADPGVVGGIPASGMSFGNFIFMKGLAWMWPCWGWHRQMRRVI